MKSIQIDDEIVTLVVHCRPNDEPSWDITSIEMYADVECTQLIGDDISIGQFPPWRQLKIYASLNLAQHEEDQRRFAARIRADALSAKLLEVVS